MPISPTYEWEETDVALEVRVVLPGATKARADVSATDCMIKVNSAPYLLLLDLAGEVDDAQSSATLTADGVRFKLPKRLPGLWGRLEATGDKVAILKRRNESIDRAHARLEEARKQRLARKQQEERAAIDRQIELDRIKRCEIDNAKASELNDARAGLLDWQAQLKDQQAQGPGVQSGQKAQAGGDESDYEDEAAEEGGDADDAAGAQQRLQGAEEKAMPDHPHYYGRGWRKDKEGPDSSSEDDGNEGGSKKAARQSKNSKPQQQGGVSAKKGVEVNKASAVQAEQLLQGDSWDTVLGGGHDRSGSEKPAHSNQGQEVVLQLLPPPRLLVEPVKVEFTKLEMPHLPAREQREVEIRDWKKKNAVDEKLLADSVDVSDRQPVFLKDKGDALYKQGNYRGAVNAYSRAIQLDEGIPLLYANRAACYLKLGQPSAAVEDCSAALTLLRAREERYSSGGMDASEASAFKSQLVKVLLRRGAAHTDAGSLKEAVADYEEALKYDKGNAQIQADLAELQAALAPPDPATLRARGNARFTAGDAEGAAEAFTLLLNLPGAGVPDSERLAAFSNRAAAHLVLGRYSAAETDCREGLVLAAASLVQALHVLAAPTVPLPPPSTSSASNSMPLEVAPHGGAGALSGARDAGVSRDAGRSPVNDFPAEHLQPAASAATPGPTTCHTTPVPEGTLEACSRLHALLSAAVRGPTCGTAAAGEAADQALWSWVGLGEQGTAGLQQHNSHQAQGLGPGGVEAHHQQKAPGAVGLKALVAAEQAAPQAGVPFGAGTASITGNGVDRSFSLQQQQQQDGAPAGSSAPGTSSSSTSGGPIGSTLQSMSRLLARRGAARGHMRQYTGGAADYRAGAALLRVMGQGVKADALEGDARRLEECGQQQGQQQSVIEAAVPAAGQPSRVQEAASEAAAGGQQQHQQQAHAGEPQHLSRQVQPHVMACA